MGTIIKIEGAKYPIRFGVGAFRILGKDWNLPGLQSVVDKVTGIFPKEEGAEITFENMDLFAEVIIAGLKNADKNYEDNLSIDEILTGVMFNTENQELVTGELLASFPGVSGNAEPRSKARKTATKKKVK